MIRPLLLILTLLIPADAAASTPAAQEDVAWLEALRIEHNVPALGAAWVDDEGVRRVSVTGVGVRGKRTAVTAESRWHLGSCSKAMTATLAARLVESGVMRWDMTLQEVFPKRARDFRAPYRLVTLEQLVTHRGGIPGEVVGTPAWTQAWKLRGTPPAQRRRFMEDVLKMEPGTPRAYAYSNAGFAIAGHMCEVVARKPWESLMREQVFEPLGMRDAGFGPPDEAGRGQPQGHRAGGTPAPGLDNPPAIAPAGAVHATLDGWGRFVRAHLRPVETVDGDVFLSQAALDTLHRPAAGAGKSYAKGWIVAERDWGGTVLNHAGTNTVWYAVVWASPEKGFAAVAVCNQGGDAAAAACDAAAWEAIGQASGRGD